MAGNSSSSSFSSSSSNESLHHLHPTIYCFVIAKPSSLIFTFFSITSILLLLPLCLLVIFLGLQRRRSTSAAAAATSHSDSFTYHMVAMEMTGVFGCILNCCGVYRGNVHLFYVGYSLWFFNWYGEMFFHLLTCVERYLAVVHPVTYLSLRGEKGTRLRNISIGCVWLLCCGLTALFTVDNLFWVDFCLIFFTLIIISFCSLSVLRVLIRPGPGEEGGARGRVDQSKRRAFYTMLVILGVLFMRFSGNLVVIVLPVAIGNTGCVIFASEFWFSLPTSLVLPLLFLHRAGISSCWKNTKGG